MEKNDHGARRRFNAHFSICRLQHAESIKGANANPLSYSGKACRRPSLPTYRETFETITQFAELHRDIVEQFGRFPHRNRAFEPRKYSQKKTNILSGDSPDFGQGG